MIFTASSPFLPVNSGQDRLSSSNIHSNYYLQQLASSRIQSKDCIFLILHLSEQNIFACFLGDQPLQLFNCFGQRQFDQKSSILYVSEMIQFLCSGKLINFDEDRDTIDDTAAISIPQRLVIDRPFVILSCNIRNQSTQRSQLNQQFNMAYYYNLPKKNTITKAQVLRIQEENQLKFASQQASFRTILFLNMKNTKVNDDSTKCLGFIETEIKVESIDLSENFSFITDRTIENLCNCQGLINLKMVNLADNNITDLGVEMMSNHSNFKHLKTLIMYGNSDVTWISFLSLAKSEWIKSLERLDFHATSISDKGLVEFFYSENSKTLTELNISMNWNRITDVTMEALSKSQYTKGLKILNLEDCAVTDNGIMLMCQSQNFANLESLNLSNSIEKSKNKITDKSLESMAFSKAISSLKSLYLKATNVSSSGIKHLTGSHLIQKLQVLKLSHCKMIDNSTLQYIGSMINYTNLTKLHVNSTSVTRQSATQFEEKFPKIMIIY